MARTVGVKEAHQQLTRLIRAAEEGDQVVITREGTPVAILLGADQFNSMIATLEEMADPGGRCEP
jgi:prevent-host-death family protein